MQDADQNRPIFAVKQGRIDYNFRTDCDKIWAVAYDVGTALNRTPRPSDFSDQSRLIPDGKFPIYKVRAFAF